MTHFSAKLKVFFNNNSIDYCNGDLSKPVKQYVAISAKWLQVNIRKQ